MLLSKPPNIILLSLDIQPIIFIYQYLVTVSSFDRQDGITALLLASSLRPFNIGDVVELEAYPYDMDRMLLGREKVSGTVHAVVHENNKYTYDVDVYGEWSGQPLGLKDGDLNQTMKISKAIVSKGAHVNLQNAVISSLLTKGIQQICLPAR
jgi:hypothetical protein